MDSNEIAAVIMNGKLKINTTWGAKKVAGIADMLDRDTDPKEFAEVILNGKSVVSG